MSVLVQNAFLCCHLVVFILEPPFVLRQTKLLLQVLYTHCARAPTHIVPPHAHTHTLARFRKQHEQLQQVIMRVLRSQSSSTPTEGAEVETDDLSAVREVKLAYENVKVVDCLDISPEGIAAWEAALKR